MKNLDLALQEKSTVNNKKDLESTYQEVTYFKRTEGSIGLSLVENVLSAVAYKRPKVGYVTGMNHLAAALLYHSWTVVAFWIMKKLIDEYKLDEVYEVGSPGISLHSRIIEMLLFSEDAALKKTIVLKRLISHREQLNLQFPCLRANGQLRCSVRWFRLV